MTDAPAPQELLDIAARLAGVSAVDLLNVVRRADGTLVVLLATGQKYTFDPATIAAQLGAELDQLIRAQLIGAGSPRPPAPPAAPPAAPPDPKPPKPRKAG